MRAFLTIVAALLVGSDALGVGPVRTKIQQKRAAKAAPKCSAPASALAQSAAVAPVSSCVGGSCPAPAAGIFGGK